MGGLSDSAGCEGKPDLLRESKDPKDPGLRCAASGLRALPWLPSRPRSLDGVERNPGNAGGTQRTAPGCAALHSAKGPDEVSSCLMPEESQRDLEHDQQD